MNGVIITVALRMREAKECLKSVLTYTPKPYKIIMVHCPGRPDLDAEWPAQLAAKHPEVIFKKIDGRQGGMTAAWNLGFKTALAEGCDNIVCMNDDVFVNKTWPNIFDTINGWQRPAIVGPISSNPGCDYTGGQKRDAAREIISVFTKEQPAGSKQKMYFCLNGFCFGLSGTVCRDLIDIYGDVLDAEKYPWGGQEEDLGRRLQKLEGDLVVDNRTYVEHVKFSDWRKLNLHKD